MAAKATITWWRLFYTKELIQELNKCNEQNLKLHNFLQKKREQLLLPEDIDQEERDLYTEHEKFYNTLSQRIRAIAESFGMDSTWNSPIWRLVNFVEAKEKLIAAATAGNTKVVKKQTKLMLIFKPLIEECYVWEPELEEFFEV